MVIHTPETPDGHNYAAVEDFNASSVEQVRQTQKWGWGRFFNLFGGGKTTEQAKRPEVVIPPVTLNVPGHFTASFRSQPDGTWKMDVSFEKTKGVKDIPLTKEQYAQIKGAFERMGEVFRIEDNFAHREELLIQQIRAAKDDAEKDKLQVARRDMASPNVKEFLSTARKHLKPVLDAFKELRSVDRGSDVYNTRHLGSGNAIQEFHAAMRRVLDEYWNNELDPALLKLAREESQGNYRQRATAKAESAHDQTRKLLRRSDSDAAQKELRRKVRIHN